MKVLVDRELCESNALCVTACPQVFKMDDDELVILVESPDESLRNDIIAAINVCPVSRSASPKIDSRLRRAFEKLPQVS